MKPRLSSIVFHAVLLASAIMSGCGMLGGGGGLGALGDLSKLIPGGAGLALSESENELFMTGREMNRVTPDYEPRPSNSAMSPPDAGGLYGISNLR